MPVNMKPSNNANKQFYPIKLQNLEAVSKGVKTEVERMKSSKVASFTHNIIKSVSGLAYDYTEDYAPDMMSTFKTMKEVISEAKKETKTFKDQLKTTFASSKNKSIDADKLTDYIAEQTVEITKRLKSGELYKSRNQRIEEAIRKEFPDLAELESDLGELGEAPSSDTYEYISDEDTLSSEPFGGVKKGRTRRVNVSAKQRAQRAKSPTRKSSSSRSTSSLVNQLVTTYPSSSEDTGLSGQIASSATSSVGKALLQQNEIVSAKAGALSEHHFNKLYTYQNGILRGINSVVTFNNNVVSKQIASQMEFQGKSLALAQDTMNAIKELKDAVITFNGYSDKVKKGDKLAEALNTNTNNDELFDENGKLSVKNYIKTIKQNISRELGSSTMGGILLSTKTANNLLGEDNIMKNSMSVMDMITGALVKSMISRKTTGRLRDMSEAYANFLPSMVNKFRAASLYSDSAWKQRLGRLFTDTRASLNVFKEMGLGDKTEDSYRWTRKSDRTLNEVIPTLLSKQLSAMTGNDELYYDYKTGKFSNTKLLENKFKRQLNENLIGRRNLAMTGTMAENVIRIKNTEDTSNMNERDKYTHSTLLNVSESDIVKYMNVVSANITKSNVPFMDKLAVDEGIEFKNGVPSFSTYANQLTAGIPHNLKAPILIAFTRQWRNMSNLEREGFNGRAAINGRRIQDSTNSLVRGIASSTSGLSTIEEIQREENARLIIDDLNNNAKYRIDRNSALNTISNIKARQARRDTINRLADEYGIMVEEDSKGKFRAINSSNTVSANRVSETAGIGSDASFSTEGNVQNIYKLLVNGIVVYPQASEIPKSLQDLRKHIWKNRDIGKDLDKYNSDTIRQDAKLYTLSRERELIERDIQSNPIAAILGLGRNNDIKKNGNPINRAINKLLDFAELGLTAIGGGTSGGKGLTFNNGTTANEQLTYEQIRTQKEFANVNLENINKFKSVARHIPLGGLLASALTFAPSMLLKKSLKSADEQAKMARDTVLLDHNETVAYLKSKFGKDPVKYEKWLNKLRKQGKLEAKLTSAVKRLIDLEDVDALNATTDEKLRNASLFDGIADGVVANSAVEQLENGKAGAESGSSPTTLLQPNKATVTAKVPVVSRASREIKPDFTTTSVGMKSIYDLLANGIVTYNLKGSSIPKNLRKIRSNLFNYNDNKMVEAIEKEEELVQAANTAASQNNKPSSSNFNLVDSYNDLLNYAPVNKHRNYGKQARTLSTLNVLTLGAYKRVKGYRELRDMMFAMGFIEAQKWSRETLYASILGLDSEKLAAIRETDEFKDLEKNVKKKSIRNKVVNFYKDTRDGVNAFGKGLRKFAAATRMISKDTTHFRKIIKLLYNRQHLIDPGDTFNVYKLSKPELLAYINSLPERSADDKEFKDAILATEEYKELVNGYSSWKPKNLLKTLIINPGKAIAEKFTSTIINPLRMIANKSRPFKNLLELMKMYIKANPNSVIKPNDVYKWTPYQLYANILAIPDDDYENAKFKTAIMKDELFTKLEKFVSEGGNGIIKSTIKAFKKVVKAVKFGANSMPIFGKIRRYKNIVWFLSHQKGYEHAIDVTDPGILLALLDAWHKDESEINGTKSARDIVYRSLKSTKEYMELEAAAEYQVNPNGKSLREIRNEKKATRKRRNKLISKYSSLTSTLSIQGYSLDELKDPVTLKNTIDNMADEKTRTYLQSTRDYKRLAAEVDKGNYGGSLKDLTNTLKKSDVNKPHGIDYSKIKDASFRMRFQNSLKELEAEGEESIKKTVKEMVNLRSTYMSKMKEAGLPYSETGFKAWLSMWGGAGLWGIDGKGTQLHDEFYTEDTYVDSDGKTHANTKSKNRLKRINDFEKFKSNVDDELRAEIRENLIKNNKEFATNPIYQDMLDDIVETKLNSKEYRKEKKNRISREKNKRINRVVKYAINAHNAELDHDLHDLTDTRIKAHAKLAGSEDSARSVKASKEILNQLYDRASNIRLTCTAIDSFFDDVVAHPGNQGLVDQIDEMTNKIEECKTYIQDFRESFKTIIKSEDAVVKRYKVYDKCIEIDKWFTTWLKRVRKLNTALNKAKKGLKNRLAEASKRNKQRVDDIVTQVNAYAYGIGEYANGAKAGIVGAYNAMGNLANKAKPEVKALLGQLNPYIYGLGEYANSAKSGISKLGNKAKNGLIDSGLVSSETFDNVVELKNNFQENASNMAARFKRHARSLEGFKVIGKLLKIPKIRKSNKRDNDTNEMNEAYSSAMRNSNNPVYSVLCSIAAGINRQNTTSRSITSVLGINEKDEIDEKNKESYPSLLYGIMNKLSAIKEGIKGGNDAVSNSVKFGIMAALLGGLASGAGIINKVKSLSHRIKKEGVANTLIYSDISQDFDSEGNKKGFVQKGLDNLSESNRLGKMITNTVSGVKHGANFVKSTASKAKGLIAKITGKGAASTVSKEVAKEAAGEAVESGAKNAAKKGGSIVFKSLDDFIGNVLKHVTKLISKLPFGESITKAFGKVSKLISKAVTKVSSKMGIANLKSATVKAAGKEIPVISIVFAVGDLVASGYRGLTNAAKIFEVDPSRVTGVMRTVSAMVEIIPSIISGILAVLGTLTGVAVFAAVTFDIVRAFIDTKWLTTELYKIFASDSELQKWEAAKSDYEAKADALGTTAERLAQYEANHRGIKGVMAKMFVSKEKQAAKDAAILFGDDPEAMDKYKEFTDNYDKDIDKKLAKDIAYKKGDNVISAIASYAKELIDATKDWYSVYSMWCTGGVLGNKIEKVIKNLVMRKLKSAKFADSYDAGSVRAKCEVSEFNKIMFKQFLSSVECRAAVSDSMIDDDALVPKSVKKKRNKKQKKNKKGGDDNARALIDSISNKVSKLVVAFMSYFFKTTSLEKVNPFSNYCIFQDAFVGDIAKVISKIIIDSKASDKQKSKFEKSLSKGKVKEYNVQNNNGNSINYDPAMGMPTDLQNINNDHYVKEHTKYESTINYSPAMGMPSNLQRTNDEYYTKNVKNAAAGFTTLYETKKDVEKAAKAKAKELKKSPTMMNDLKREYPILSKIKNYKDANKAFHDKDSYAAISNEINRLLSSGDSELIAYFADKIGKGWNKGGGKVKEINSLSKDFKKDVDAMLNTKTDDYGEEDPNGQSLKDRGIGIRESVRSPLLQLAYYSKNRSSKDITDMLLKMAGQSEGWNWGEWDGYVTQTLATNHSDGNAVDFEVNENNYKDIGILGNIARKFGLNWGGDWSNFKDYPHVQKFAKGGIVKGPLEGDRVPIKANGGEMVLTRSQQSVLFGFLKDVADKYKKGEPVAKLTKNPFATSDEKTIEMINEALEIQRKIYNEQVRHDNVTEKLLTSIVSLVEVLTSMSGGNTSKNSRAIRENIQDISSSLTNGALANASGI